ncbi:type I restriction enzyme R subunit [Methanocalculus alkaliphilus]|uniref:type I restriction endonuclease subunit R n=1 Tax=Methanocalculus alkaliphilus TaxID=768730 RepID=UPI00209D94CA|nr:HsdR family type I site-specific deoxyribonuclease [Methanocalculus alkaliphilus]MCP1715469.1 type I restriction enzyme R subunit [Methanocalculus alkaliphilus]
MPKPGEHKTVQARILAYAEEIGWTFVSRAEAERRRHFNQSAPSPSAAAHVASLYFEDLLYEKVREFNQEYRAITGWQVGDIHTFPDNPATTLPSVMEVRETTPAYHATPGALISELQRLQNNIYGNRDMHRYLCNEATYYSAEEKRELNLNLIDYDNPEANVYEVTEEYTISNGRYSIREDVVFLINGIPVLVIECKNANKDEAIALGIDQIRRYHAETPEIFVPEMIYSVTEAIGFSYGATWNTIRRNIFNWKDEEIGNLEAKIKTFCSIPHILALIKQYILFAEKDEELQKFILRQHQTSAVEKVVERCLEPTKQRGLVWHTQGSGKTFTMIKAADLLFRAADANKPTIILMIDRNELEDHILRNLAMLGLQNVEHANKINRLIELLRNDYRGIIVTMIHKFNDMPANICERSNVYVLIDEAHRTTGGDLGTYLFAGLPNATMIGFTGTPIDKTAHGKGTFKTFGLNDPKGYLDKYSISDSIIDKTTLPLFYNLAPNELLANPELMEKEFWSLAETEGVSDISELNRILERAVNLKNFLKADERVDKVAKYVADHFVRNVEPLGYKAFLVGVDRPACAKYKLALDKYLPAEYSAVVYTGNNNDTKELKAYHLDKKAEKQIRKNFPKFGIQPKILIVTEKLLTGYDAPILYAMYLDKPMRDHTLLQAIARVNRPYENEAEEMVKPHGFVLDFVGIFDKLEKALAFDSDEVNAIVKDIALLKGLFKLKMEKKVPQYLALIHHNFTDKDVDGLIEHFRDKDRRKEFFREYKEIEMLYEIISPDAFLRPYLEDYATLSAIYSVVRKAYAKKIMIDRAFQRKTNELVQQYVDIGYIEPIQEFIEINAETIELIKNNDNGDSTRIINLIKSIQTIAKDESDDPFLIAMSERARMVQERYEDRQTSTAEALSELFDEINKNEERKKEQSEKGFDGLTFFVYRALLDAGVEDAEEASIQIKQAFIEYPNWRTSESELREVRNNVTFAIYAKIDNLDEVAAIVDELFSLLTKAYEIDK